MAFSLPALPFAPDALAPHMSAETFEYHHGKHHQAYVTALNGFVEKDPALQGKSLDDIVKATAATPRRARRSLSPPLRHSGIAQRSTAPMSP